MHSFKFVHMSDGESSYDENCFEELHVEDSEVLSVEMNAKGLQYLEGF